METVQQFLIPQVMWPVSITISGLVGSFVMFAIKSYWSANEKRKEKDDDRHDTLEAALNANTMAIVELRIKFDGLSKMLEIMTQQNKDLCKLGEQIRDIDKKINSALSDRGGINVGTR